LARLSPTASRQRRTASCSSQPVPQPLPRSLKRSLMFFKLSVEADIGATSRLWITWGEASSTSWSAVDNPVDNSVEKPRGVWGKMGRTIETGTCPPSFSTGVVHLSTTPAEVIHRLFHRCLWIHREYLERRRLRSSSISALRSGASRKSS